MSGILATLGSSLPPGIAIGAFLAPCLIWLAHRAICFLELRMILRALPRDDRVTAAVAYVNAQRTKAVVPCAPAYKHLTRPGHSRQV